MLATVVALVPTPDAGTCFSSSEARPDIAANVANNIPAAFLAGLAGVAMTAAVARGDSAPEGTRGSYRHGVGMSLALAVLVGGFGWFLLSRQSFLDYAHYGAAFPLFGTIVAVVLLNARGYGRRLTAVTGPRQAYRNRYTAIAALMLTVPAGMWLVSLVVRWDHVALWVEATLLLLFAAFWTSQTQELWNEGVRGQRSRSSGRRVSQ